MGQRVEELLGCAPNSLRLFLQGSLDSLGNWRGWLWGGQEEVLVCPMVPKLRCTSESLVGGCLKIPCPGHTPYQLYQNIWGWAPGISFKDPG